MLIHSNLLIRKDNVRLWSCFIVNVKQKLSMNDKNMRCFVINWSASTKVHLAYLDIHVHIRVTRPTRHNKIVADLYSPCHCLIYFGIFTREHLSYRAGKVWYNLVVFTCSCSVCMVLHGHVVLTWSCSVYMLVQCLYVHMLLGILVHSFLVYFKFAQYTFYSPAHYKYKKVKLQQNAGIQCKNQAG